MFRIKSTRRRLAVASSIAAAALAAGAASTLTAEAATARAEHTEAKSANATGAASLTQASTPRLLTFELRNSGGRFLAVSFTGFGTQLTLQSPGKEKFGVGYRWKIIPTSTSPMLENFDVPGCMDVGDGKAQTAAGVPITVQPCDGSSSQRWVVVSNPINPNFFTIKNEFSQKLVTKSGTSISDGTKFTQQFGIGSNPLLTQQFAMTDTG